MGCEEMAILKEVFGKTQSNKDVYLFILSNEEGMKVKIINYGATVVSIVAKDKNGKYDDVVLGYDTIEGYENGDKYFGAVVGRCANRIENGIFNINGREYRVCTNSGENHLHGGKIGFDKVVWDIIDFDEASNTLEFVYNSFDGEEGYPGNLMTKVKYTLTEDNSLEIEYKAVSDKDTVVNLTNHSYFNLAGHASGDALNHMVKINSDKFTANNSNSIPTGELRSVEGTPMDFRNFKRVGDYIDCDYEQIVIGSGFDHNWVVDINKGISEKAAEIVEENTGRKLEVFTTMPGMQFYSANFLDGNDVGKNNATYIRRSALCFETQYAPNAINIPEFKSPLLKAGDEYKEKTIYRFSII